MKVNNTSQSAGILITGGTGSFGRGFVDKILRSKKYANYRVVVYSRDELKQWEMQQLYPKSLFPNLRFYLGDIRDKYRFKRALDGIDIVIHAAALKQVPTGEYNPIEFISTNVIGSQNIIEASLDSNVSKVVALSTDKAASPINLYGATKLCSDKLFVAANNISGTKNQIFSVVRYGNVMGSRGSVIPLFLKQKDKGILSITDESMTRFTITLKEAVSMVYWVLDNCLGGEIFVPKIPSYRIMDLAEAIAPSCEKKLIGIRPGEKVHEELITPSDSYSTIDLGDYYAILSADGLLEENYKREKKNFTQVKNGFSYNSGSNPDILSVKQIRELIKDYRIN